MKFETRPEGDGGGSQVLLRGRNVPTGEGIENASALHSHDLHSKDTKVIRVSKQYGKL